MAPQTENGDADQLLRLAIRLRPYVDLAKRVQGEDSRDLAIPQRLYDDLTAYTGKEDAASAMEEFLRQIKEFPDWKETLARASAAESPTERCVISHATYSRFKRHFGGGRAGGRLLDDGTVEIFLSKDTLKDLLDSSDETDVGRAMDKLLDRTSPPRGVTVRLPPPLARSFVSAHPEYASKVDADGVFRGVVDQRVAEAAGFKTVEEAVSAIDARVRDWEAGGPVEDFLKSRGVEVFRESGGESLRESLHKDKTEERSRLWRSAREDVWVETLKSQMAREGETYDFGRPAAERLVRFDPRFRVLIEFRGDRAHVRRTPSQAELREAGFRDRREVRERLIEVMKVIDAELEERGRREDEIRAARDLPEAIPNGGQLLKGGLKWTRA